MVRTRRSSKLQVLEMETNGSHDEEGDGIEALNKDSAL